MPVVAIQPNKQVPIPSQMLEKLGWGVGKAVYLYPLENGITIRSKPSPALEAAREFEGIMREEGVELRDLLDGLEYQRERKHHERTAQEKTGG
ncbi:MAG: hypothetical protein AUJ92_09850 [Armatimonadetes bacterium CG2_30_59_28]|nr:MAG: hypothetical protein AUJ92_09850 [Armatimonadetes bacterium CG2_30_59_28]PIU66987.1 MAG: hypothetical protein COS85_02455 [Armatimonadetes bacterium CG07_land_8_20_14_0_80_59_28]PIX45328.1 MAG: hypothetical protein COZ56_02085 [Armatimonadetes bacterium CG_4_8_14_3_um_filter_58_9]PIY38948.1 MAG: hypothetical protein COZ05_19950 [Armatimonadetes bacterium CG_4_10_14_3_um_filter_59_10]PJB77585.1 MAG: hypothetical protein CO095_01440 [Armatimonadetes bacterium CG_4_9_14_3_um_filter_58_7]